MKKYIGVATAIIAGLSLLPAFAQANQSTADDYGISAPGTYCPSLSTTLRRGSRDASTNNEVTELQKFLADYYNFDPVELVSGYFGRITQTYLIKYQKEQGLPAYGIAGSLTRASIASVCTQDTTPVAATNGCPRGALYSSITGAVCHPTTSSSDGCPPGALYSSLTGAACPGATYQSPTISYAQAGPGVDRGVLVPGKNAHVYGTNLPTYPLIVNMGNYSTSGQASSDGTDVQFTTPLELPVGFYNLNLATQKGVLTNSVQVSVGVTTACSGSCEGPHISQVSHTDGANGVSEAFSVTGQNLTSGSVLSYVDTAGAGAGRTGKLSYVLSSSFPTMTSFAGDLYTANTASTYKVKVVDAQGRSSNELTVNTINGCSQGVLYSSTTGAPCPNSGVPAPTVTSTSAKAAGNFEMDAGGQASVMGSTFTAGVGANAKVYIGNTEAPISSYSDTRLDINVPSSLSAGQTYDLYVVTGAGTSNVVRVKILSNLGSVPTINSITQTPSSAGPSYTISGQNFTGGDGRPVAMFYSSSGALVGFLYFVSMDSISANTLTFHLTELKSPKDGATAVPVTPDTYQVKVQTNVGTSNPYLLTVQVPPPTIDSYSVNSGDQTFSLSARNYSTITFRADCGSFVHILMSTDRTSVSYPGDRASLCNAEQNYSNPNAMTSLSTNIVNQPLNLFDYGGAQTSYIGNGPTTNNSGSAGLTVKVCNTAGVCVEKTGLLTIYAKG